LSDKTDYNKPTKPELVSPFYREAVGTMPTEPTPTIDAFNVCNVCNTQILTPNPMGYCDKHLAESIAETAKPTVIPLIDGQLVEERPSTTGPVLIGSKEWDDMVAAERKKEAEQKANRQPRDFMVYYCPSRKPGTLSYHAEEVKDGKVSAGMAWKPVKVVKAKSENHAITTFKQQLTELAQSNGKTYAELAERLSRSY